MYNGVLVLPVKDETMTLGFADDGVERIRLVLADEKTVAVLTNCRRKNTVKVDVGGHTIPSKPDFKYLRVIDLRNT